MRTFHRATCPRAASLSVLGIATLVLLLLRAVLENEKATTANSVVLAKNIIGPLSRNIQRSADPDEHEEVQSFRPTRVSTGVTGAEALAVPPERWNDRPVDDGFRIMFVGDSITEGIYSPMSSPLRGRAPKEGSCSYRFRLLQLLYQKRRQGVSMQPITPVGPFGGHVGSHNTPPACVRGVLDDGFVRGITDRHAAVWGVTAAQLTGTDSLYRTRQFARKHYFGKKAQFISSKDASWAVATSSITISPRPFQGAEHDAMRILQHHLRRWSAAYRPALATLLLGTNDLSAGAQVDEVVLQLLPEAVLQLVCPMWVGPSLPWSRVTTDETLGNCSGTRLAVATLLPRAPPLHLLVDDVNDWLAAIRRCKRSATTTQCISCVQRSVPLYFHRTRDNATGRAILGQPAWQKFPAHSTDALLVIVARAAIIWCMKQVVILNISSPNVINASETFMYDGLHPNAHGERAVAELIAEGLVEEGIV